VSVIGTPFFFGGYFATAFVQMLNKKVPELVDAGINIQQTNVQSYEGQVVEATAQASNGVSLNLGSVTLDGVDVLPRELVTIDTLIAFVENNAKQTL
jgi:hypothetical protein